MLSVSDHDHLVTEGGRPRRCFASRSRARPGGGGGAQKKWPKISQPRVTSPLPPVSISQQLFVCIGGWARGRAARGEVGVGATALRVG